MALDPIDIQLSDGQKLEVLKRYRNRYGDALQEVEVEITTIKTQLAEFEFAVQYLGEQPEVQELKDRAGELEKLEQRRQHLGMLVDRLNQVIPQQSGGGYQRF